MKTKVAAPTEEEAIEILKKVKVDFLINGDKDILSCKNLKDWAFKILTPKGFVEIMGEKIDFFRRFYEEIQSSI
ncbi:MAG: hypothetical protein ACP5K2_07330 [bacterium]